MEELDPAIRKKQLAAERQRRFRERHPDRTKTAKQKSYRAHATAHMARTARWREENPERHKELAAKARAKRRESKANRLNDAVRVAVRQCLSGAKRRRSWEKLVGYTLADLIVHLERQFSAGMSWDNYGEWHVDHIRPLASFAITSAECEEFKAAWSLPNLRPMWGRENQSKGGRLSLLL